MRDNFRVRRCPIRIIEFRHLLLTTLAQLCIRVDCVGESILSTTSSYLKAMPHAGVNQRKGVGSKTSPLLRHEENHSSLAKTDVAQDGSASSVGINKGHELDANASMDEATASDVASERALISRDRLRFRDPFDSAVETKTKNACPMWPSKDDVQGFRQYCVVRRWSKSTISNWGLNGHDRYVCKKDSLQPPGSTASGLELCERVQDEKGSYPLSVDGHTEPREMVYRLYEHGRCKINCEGMRTFYNFVQYVPQIPEVKCSRWEIVDFKKRTRQACICNDPANVDETCCRVLPRFDFNVTDSSLLCAPDTRVYFNFVCIIVALAGLCTAVSYIRHEMKRRNNRDDWD